jgi:hypothetical protein
MEPMSAMQGPFEKSKPLISNGPLVPLPRPWQRARFARATAGPNASSLPRATLMPSEPAAGSLDLIASGIRPVGPSRSRATSSPSGMTDGDQVCGYPGGVLGDQPAGIQSPWGSVVCPTSIR